MVNMLLDICDVANDTEYKNKCFEEIWKKIFYKCALLYSVPYTKC